MCALFDSSLHRTATTYERTTLKKLKIIYRLEDSTRGYGDTQWYFGIMPKHLKARRFQQAINNVILAWLNTSLLYVDPAAQVQVIHCGGMLDIKERFPKYSTPPEIWHKKLAFTMVRENLLHFAVQKVKRSHIFSRWGFQMAWVLKFRHMWITDFHTLREASCNK